MKEQCDYRDGHDMKTDRPMGNRCEAQATHLIEWNDGRFSLGCAAHLTIENDATVKPAAVTPLADAKRFYSMENRDISYSFVAFSIEHCKQILCDHGVVLLDKNSDEIQLVRGRYDLFEMADCEWHELTRDQAALKFTISEDGPEADDYRAPLANRELGAWFCSEY